MQEGEGGECGMNSKAMNRVKKRDLVVKILIVGGQLYSLLRLLLFQFSHQHYVQLVLCACVCVFLFVW